MIVRSPQPLLAAFVEHYWLARDNRDTAYRILPDGCVDFVVEIGGGGATDYLPGRAATPHVDGRQLDVPVLVHHPLKPDRPLAPGSPHRNATRPRLAGERGPIPSGLNVMGSK
jgi:hypothetical protein